MVFHLVLERLARRTLPRVLEPDLVMSDPRQVAAFGDSGREDGILAFLYFFHALQSLPVIRAGDRVLDLACGPANQLALLAHLNPEARFVGLDASTNMLESARTTLAQHGIANVELIGEDMTQLHSLADASMDCVVCTMSLHHLRDTGALAAALRAAHRVLKPGGGIYLADFGRLRRRATQTFFAEDRRDRQTAQFTQDFLQSQQAAFSVTEMSQAVTVLGTGLTCYQTALAPFMVVFRSAARRELGDADLRSARLWHSHMTSEQRRDFRNFSRWFRLGGMELPCTLD